MDMSVNIAGVEWKNPVTVASGTFGSGAEFVLYILTIVNERYSFWYG